MFAAHMASLDKDKVFFDSFPRGKKCKLTKTSSQKYIICGEDRNGILRKGRAVGTLVSAVKRRKDNVFRRLAGEESWRISTRKMCTGIRLLTPAIPATKIFAMLSVILTLLSLNMYPAK